MASKSSLISCCNLPTNLLPGDRTFSNVLQPTLSTPVPTGQVAPHLLRSTDLEQKCVSKSTGILTFMIIVLEQYFLNGIKPNLWECHLLCLSRASKRTQSEPRWCEPEQRWTKSCSVIPCDRRELKAAKVIYYGDWSHGQKKLFFRLYRGLGLALNFHLTGYIKWLLHFQKVTNCAKQNYA